MYFMNLGNGIGGYPDRETMELRREELSKNREDISISHQETQMLNLLPGRSISAADVQKVRGSDVATTSERSKYTTATCS